MPGWRANNDGFNIICEDEFLAKWPVKNKIELVFRMLYCNAFQAFIRKPAYSFEFIVKQEPGIYSNFHWMRISLFPAIKEVLEFQSGFFFYKVPERMIIKVNGNPFNGGIRFNGFLNLAGFCFHLNRFFLPFHGLRLDTFWRILNY